MIAPPPPAPPAWLHDADVYGSWQDEPVGESVPTRPATSYAEAKLVAERELGAVSLRVATAYGPGETGLRAIPAVIRALSAGEPPVVHGDGGDVHDYVHVDDVAAAFLNAAGSSLDSAVLNIGSGIGRTTLEVLKTVASALGVEPHVRYEPSPRAPAQLVLDPAAARLVLGFEPRRDFEAVVREEAEWLRRVTP